MRFLVIDGQGGRLGKLLIEEIRKEFPGEEIMAVGTNATAASTKPVWGHNDQSDNRGESGCCRMPQSRCYHRSHRHCYC